MTTQDALNAGLSPCGGLSSICGYDKEQNPMYCFGKISFRPCPDGCDCRTEDEAKAQGYTTFCNGTQTICGYLNQTPRYCWTKPNVTCPRPCNCMLNATAHLMWGNNYTQCLTDRCGFVQNAASSTVMNEFCFRELPTPVVNVTCPRNCNCMQNATAHLMWGNNYTQCLTDRCGFVQNAASSTVTDEFCFRELPTPVVNVTCPKGECNNCMSEVVAQSMWGMNNYTKCLQDRCGLTNKPGSTEPIPEYCYKGAQPPLGNITCTEPCLCRAEEQAHLMWGNNYTQCSPYRCGLIQNPDTSELIPKYCFKRNQTPVVNVTCTAPCYCWPEELAHQKWGDNYHTCSPNQCGLIQIAGSSTVTTEYCFGEGNTTVPLTTVPLTTVPLTTVPLTTVPLSVLPVIFGVAIAGIFCLKRKIR